MGSFTNDGMSSVYDFLILQDMETALDSSVGFLSIIRSFKKQLFDYCLV